MNRRMVALSAVSLAIAGLSLTACSSSSEPAPATTSAVSEDPGTAEAGQPSSEILAMCEKIVADGLSEADAVALAEGAGYTTRIGSVDGAPNPLTMDYRDNRMTFDIEGAIVVGCNVG